MKGCIVVTTSGAEIEFLNAVFEWSEEIVNIYSTVSGELIGTWYARNIAGVYSFET